MSCCPGGGDVLPVEPEKREAGRGGPVGGLAPDGAQVRAGVRGLDVRAHGYGPAECFPGRAHALGYFRPGSELRTFLRAVAREYIEPGVPMVVLETALPIKFAATIVEALGREPERPAALAGIEQLPKRFKVMPVDVAGVKQYIAQNG